MATDEVVNANTDALVALTEAIKSAEGGGGLGSGVGRGAGDGAKGKGGAFGGVLGRAAAGAAGGAFGAAAAGVSAGSGAGEATPGRRGEGGQTEVIYVIAEGGLGLPTGGSRRKLCAWPANLGTRPASFRILPASRWIFGDD